MLQGEQRRIMQAELFRMCSSNSLPKMIIFGLFIAILSGDFIPPGVKSFFNEIKSFTNSQATEECLPIGEFRSSQSSDSNLIETWQQMKDCRPTTQKP